MRPARREDLYDAVAAVDALARCGRFDPNELLARHALAPGARNCRRLDQVLALVDPRAESRMESELRLMRFTVGDVDLHPPRTVHRVAHMLAERLRA